MRTLSTLFLVTLTIALPASLFGQVICLSDFPSPSPVLSSSPDDIPATNDVQLTYTGAHAARRANHNMSFMQTGPNEQKVWFFSDNTMGEHEHVYYNRRYRANSSSPWYWEFSVSPAVTSYGATAGAVLYSPTPRYVDTRTSTPYNYIMYQVVQPPECGSAVLGYLEVIFSNDGICWTSPQWATRLGGPMAPCIGISNSVPVEQVTAFDDGSLIELMGMEGSIPYLLDPDNMNDTAVIGSSSVYDPSSIGLYASPKVANAGIVSPYYLYPTWNYSYYTRFQPYLYFMNLQAAFDPSTGDLYVGRGYPYPFDRGVTNDMDRATIFVPNWSQGMATMLTDPDTGRSVWVGGCNYSPALVPNRIQLYKMHLGSLSNFAALGSSSGYWTFLADLGNSSGYLNDVTQYQAQTTLITYYQTNAGRDYGTVSFLRDGQGNLVRDNGVASYFAGDSFRSEKTNGPCRTTGLERETVFSVP